MRGAFVLTILLRERPSADRAPSRISSPAADPRPLGRSLLLGAGILIACLTGAKMLTTSNDKAPRATAMTLTPAAKKRLAEPRLPQRPAPLSADEVQGGERDAGRPVRRISMDATPTNSIAPQAVTVSREGTFGGFAPMERSAKYEGFHVTAGR
jgi:hypothetical protein